MLSVNHLGSPLEEEPPPAFVVVMKGPWIVSKDVKVQREQNGAVVARANASAPTLRLDPCKPIGGVLKQDGQKADDAKIPTHLWDVMFQSSWSLDPLLVREIPPNWAQGLNIFRKLLLHVW